MTQKRTLRVFLDTSVIIAAILSPEGGSRKLFRLAEIGVLQVVVGPNVLREADEVIQLKKLSSTPQLAQLLAIARAETSPALSTRQISTAKSHVQYSPDAYILAEPIRAQLDWFVTHDKEHFLKSRSKINLSFEIGTPGDLIQRVKDDLTLL